jgi:hypothetical protein
MPSFVPKEPVVDLSFQPGTIQYLRRLEKEKLQKMAEEVLTPEPVDNSAAFVDKDLLIKQDTNGNRETISQKDTISPCVTVAHLPSVSRKDTISDRDTNGVQDTVSLSDTLSNSDTISKHDTDGSRDTVSQPPPVLAISCKETVSPLNTDGHRDTDGLLDIVGGDMFRKGAPTVTPTISRLDTASHNDRASRRDIVSQPETLSRREIVLAPKTPSVSISETISNKVTVSVGDTDEQLKVTNNFMIFDKDLFPALMGMSEIEIKVYLELIRRTWGQNPPQQTCEATNAGMSYFTHVSVGSAMSRAVASLERKLLIKKLFCARTKKERSVYRVFLPSEVPGSPKSFTVIERVDKTSNV